MWSGLNDSCRMKPEVLAEKHGAHRKHCATAVIMLEVELSRKKFFFKHSRQTRVCVFIPGDSVHEGLVPT